MKKQEELTAFWKTENRLYNETNQLYHRLARHSGLSDCAFWLLYALRDEDGPLTQTQLSTLLCLPKQTVNSALKQLTEAGCLRLEAVDGNLKNKRVRLTELGERGLGAAIDDVFHLEERAAARLTAEERSALLGPGGKAAGRLPGGNGTRAHTVCRSSGGRMTPIRLSDHFTYGRLLRYTLPSIVMMIFTSLYSVVDGLFVSNLVGDLALSAVNIAFPVTMIGGGLRLHAGHRRQRHRGPDAGGGEAGAGVPVFLHVHLVRGGTGRGPVRILPHFHRAHHAPGGSQRSCCWTTVSATAASCWRAAPPSCSRARSQSFFSAAEKPKLGGCSSPWPPVPPTWCWTMCSSPCWTWASPARPGPPVLGYCVGGVIPVLYFASGKRQGLRLVKTAFYGRQLLHACTNGSSELMSNISASVRWASSTTSG